MSSTFHSLSVGKRPATIQGREVVDRDSPDGLVTVPKQFYTSDIIPHNATEIEIHASNTGSCAWAFGRIVVHS